MLPICQELTPSWIVTYTLTPTGGSQTHSPDVKLAYIRSRVRGSMISTHSHLESQNNTVVSGGGGNIRDGQYRAV